MHEEYETFWRDFFAVCTGFVFKPPLCDLSCPNISCDTVLVRKAVWKGEDGI